MPEKLDDADGNIRRVLDHVGRDLDPSILIGGWTESGLLDLPFHAAFAPVEILDRARERSTTRVPGRHARRFVAITDVRGSTERYAIDDPMTRVYSGVRGLDWR